jgi:hypothetical protein
LEPNGSLHSPIGGLCSRRKSIANLYSVQHSPDSAVIIHQSCLRVDLGRRGKGFDASSSITSCSSRTGVIPVPLSNSA